MCDSISASPRSVAEDSGIFGQYIHSYAADCDHLLLYSEERNSVFGKQTAHPNAVSICQIIPLPGERGAMMR